MIGVPVTQSPVPKLQACSSVCALVVLICDSAEYPECAESCLYAGQSVFDLGFDLAAQLCQHAAAVRAGSYAG